MSTPRYDLNFLCLAVIYPGCMMVLNDISLMRGIRTLRVGLFFVIFMSIWNPVFNQELHTTWRGIPITYGMLSGMSMLMKGILALLAMYVLVNMLTIDGLCALLREIYLPTILVVTIQLMYRYISVLNEEAKTMTQSYKLRSGGAKGIHFKEWGSFLGSLLLRTYDRSKILYESMLLRGFDGTMVWDDVTMTATDFIITILVCGAMIVARIFVG